MVQSKISALERETVGGECEGSNSICIQTWSRYVSMRVDRRNKGRIQSGKG